jgi:exodeoxyribonuclease V
MKFTDQQQYAIKEAVQSAKRGDSVYRIGGYAGSGKTTIAVEICEKLHNPAVCALTGKAAFNLRQKGITANTIHSTIYDYNRKTRTFTKKKKIQHNGLVIDEASMVSADIWYDLVSFDLPIILIGDTAQLPPIGKDVYLMQNPDIVLETIHRQKQEHGILQLANNIREKKPFIKQYPNEVSFYKKDELDVAELMDYDIILCGYNRTRHSVNQRIRYHKRYKDGMYVGEKLIVLQNNPDYGVFNGEIVEVVEILNEEHNSYALRVRSYGEEKTIAMTTSHLGQTPKRSDELDREFVYCDYAYAITVHKAQGAAFNSVAIIDEPVYGTNKERWRYTAVTRACEKVRYYINRE